MESAKETHIIDKPISRTNWEGKEVDINKYFYIECDCWTLQDIARVCISKNLIKHPTEKDRWQICMEDVTVEFNLTVCTDPAHVKQFRTPLDHFIYPIEKLFRRIKSAFDVLRGRPVFYSTNLLMNFKTANEFADKLKTSIKEVEEAAPNV